MSDLHVLILNSEADAEAVRKWRDASCCVAISNDEFSPLLVNGAIAIDHARLVTVPGAERVEEIRHRVELGQAHVSHVSELLDQLDAAMARLAALEADLVEAGRVAVWIHDNPTISVETLIEHYREELENFGDDEV